MKNLPLKRILKAQDAFYEQSDSKVKDEELDAYMMYYIEEAKQISLLDIPSSAFIENVRLLEEDIDMLTGNGVEMRDVKPENSLISKSYELFLLDTDLYRADFFSTSEEIKKSNMINIGWFIRNYLSKEIEKMKELTIEEHVIAIDMLTSTFIGNKLPHVMPLFLEKNGLSKWAEEKFSDYDRPKEYFLSRKNK